MRLLRLELFGFKSFAKRTELDFQKGITAIVGPNGSGKSNIADAVRWVLGEQSAKALRGSRMEDVIFNGTEQRKPQSFCEVSLTFDNTDGTLPLDFSEVTITRRMYRSGESEYFINRNLSRLRDIQELFRDTGIGKEGYSIIGQGRVEKILANKSGDRRAAFEEAAGVMKYRARKEEAERKLENTRKNLTRLADILEELKKQVGPLSEQSETARTFLRLRDELREIEINVFLYQYDRLNERIKTLEESLKGISEEIAAQQELEASLASACAAEEEKERALNAAMTELQNRLISLSAGAESSSGEAKLIQERMANAVSERNRLEEEIRQSQARQSEILQKLSAIDAETKQLSAQAAECEEGLARLTQERASLEQAIAEKEELLEAQKDSMIEAMNRISDAKIQLSRLDTMRDTLLKRFEAIDGEEAQVLQEGEKLSAEYAEAERAYAALEAENARCEQERSAAIYRINELNQTLIRSRQDMLDMEREASSAQSRINVLVEMKNAYEGYYASVRRLLSDANGSLALKKCIEGVVAELLSVPKEYETAIEMSLGSALQNIVTPTEQDAKIAIEYLRARQYGRATFLPVSVIRPRLLSREEREMCNVRGFIGVASELVGYDERYRGIVENLLGRTVVVDGLDAGIEINKRAHSAFRIATLSGDIINQGGSMTGGSTQKREFFLIGRTREIEELNAKMREIASGLKGRQAQCAKLEKALYEQNQALEEIQVRLREHGAECATQREKVEIIQKYVEENAQKLERLRLERAQIVDSLDDIAKQRQEAHAAETSLESGNVATQDDIRATQEQFSALRAKLAEVSERATAERVRQMSLAKELSALESERGRLNQEADALEKSVSRNRAEIASFKEKYRALEEELRGLDVNIDETRRQIERLTDQLHAMEEERARHMDALADMRNRREEAAASLSESREARHRVELNISRAQMELANIQDRIWEDYELTYENALPYRRQIAITSSHLRIDELRKQIRALGDVNLGAIEEYQAVKSRFDELSAQYEDLTKAEADLNALIDDLLNTMENEFRKQFALIQKNFAEVFAELFGGGHAELVLSDKNDILNCDIEIIAQPPGKKLQMLSLLSGGERALTAIALLFAMLKLKPTAFCILDEIESSLDEVNVSNFARYVRRYSEDTQFILITHRKGSMEVCDTLYGVAMEERGVSRVISARFSEVAG